MTLGESGCLRTIQSHGVEFRFPDFWELSEEEEAGSGDVALTVTGAGTCFWTLRILRSRPSPDDLIRSCIDAFAEEYGEIDEYPASCRIVGEAAAGREIEFICLELVNSVGLYSARTNQFTLLVWWQGTDHDLQEVRPLLDQMTRSVRIARLPTA